MKKSSVAVLILTAALAAATAKGDSYTFTAGAVIPLKINGNTADYVSTSGDMKVSSEKHVDSTKPNGKLTINLYNSATGDYVLGMLGTADGYTASYTLAVTDGASYSKSITVAQKNTKEGTTLANSNLNASNSADCNAQRAYLALENLPAGELTLTFTINSTSSGWAGNYGYFTIYSRGSVSFALDVVGNKGAVLSGLSSIAHLAKCGTVSYENNGVAFGSSKNGAAVTVSLYLDATATYGFSYDAGSQNSDGTSIKWVLLSSDGSTVKQTFTDSIARTTGWWGDGIAKNYSHSFGRLSAGFYTLTGYVINSDANVWAGNFGNFIFTGYMPLPTSDAAIDLATANSTGSLTLNGDGISIKNSLIDATKDNYTFTFHLYCEEAGAYRFSYKGGTHTSTVTWTLDGETIAIDTFSGNGSTDTCSDKKTHNLGDFSAETFHTLVGTVNCSQNWGGNYGYFQFIEAATTTIDSTTVYVEKDWLETVYGPGTTSVPAGFDSVQSDKAISGAEAYALGYNSIPAIDEVVVSPSISGTTMTFGFKDANADAAAARGARVTYTLKTGTAAGSLSEGDSSTALPTLDLATVDSVKYIKLEADVSWTTAN